VPSLERLLEHPAFEVLAVVTQPDKRRVAAIKQRLHRSRPSPDHLPVWQPQRVKKDAQTLTELKQTGADVFVVVAYGQILSQEILDMPQLGCINVHGSILPKYRGAAPFSVSLSRRNRNRHHNDVNGCGDGYGGNAAESFYTNSSARQCSRFGAEASSWGRFIGGNPVKLERQEIQPIPQESLRRPMRH